MLHAGNREIAHQDASYCTLRWLDRIDPYAGQAMSSKQAAAVPA